MINIIYLDESNVYCYSTVFRKFSKNYIFMNFIKCNDKRKI